MIRVLKDQIRVLQDQKPEYTAAVGRGPRRVAALRCRGPAAERAQRASSRARPARISGRAGGRGGGRRPARIRLG